MVEAVSMVSLNIELVAIVLGILSLSGFAELRNDVSGLYSMASVLSLWSENILFSYILFISCVIRCEN
jgi:hypothetical protein